MAVEAVNNQRSYEEYVRESRAPKQNLGKADFLNLLAAQMQYQDPLEPQKDTAFVAQLAQFSSLEQLQNLNSTMTQFQYYGLAGKYVMVSGVDGGVEFAAAGIVDSVVTRNGETYVEIGGYTYKAKYVTEVYDKELFSGSNPVVEAARLIGMSVTGPKLGAVISDATQDITGIVKSVSVSDGNGLVAILADGQRIAVSNIIAVRDPSAVAAQSVGTTDDATDESGEATDEAVDETVPETDEA